MYILRLYSTHNIHITQQVTLQKRGGILSRLSNRHVSRPSISQGNSMKFHPLHQMLGREDQFH